MTMAMTMTMTTVPPVSDKVEKMINDYVNISNAITNVKALEFWKANESVFPTLAKFAKKYLSVPASSCSVERMFSTCNHIFSLRRRRLGVEYYQRLVILKLNEHLI